MPIDHRYGSPPRSYSYAPSQPSHSPQPSHGYGQPPQQPYGYGPAPSSHEQWGGPSQSRTSHASSTSRPRTRAPHHLSDGESDSENPNVLYRSLRRDEDPRRGLRPPDGFDPSLTASQHITAGSKSKRKSEFVSATRSAKVASAWAAEGPPGGRVARFNKPRGQESYDMTDPDQARHVFPTGKGSSLNTAKASQEVVIRGHIPADHVTDVWDAHRVTMEQYREASADTVPGFERKSRSRTKADGPPKPVVLTEWVPPGDPYYYRR